MKQEDMDAKDKSLQRAYRRRTAKAAPSRLIQEYGTPERAAKTVRWSQHLEEREARARPHAEPHSEALPASKVGNTAVEDSTTVDLGFGPGQWQHHGSVSSDTHTLGNLHVSIPTRWGRPAAQTESTDATGTPLLPHLQQIGVFAAAHTRHPRALGTALIGGSPGQSGSLHQVGHVLEETHAARETRPGRAPKTRSRRTASSQNEAWRGTTEPLRWQMRQTFRPPQREQLLAACRRWLRCSKNRANRGDIRASSLIGLVDGE